MRFVKLYIVCIIIIFCTSFSEAADDWEFWPGNTVKVKLNDRTSLNFLEEFRIRKDMSSFYTYVLYAGAYVKINEYADTAVWYKFVNSKSGNDWHASHRCDADAILKYNLEGFKLSNRSRFEYNFIAVSWLYRDRVKVAREFTIFDWKFTPYISNEFFFDLSNSDGYDENRVSAGVSTPFVFNTKLTAYYMSRAKKSDDNWTNANVIGFSAGISF